MKLLVGLGNIGKEYEYTRHNTGFMFVDFFVKEVLKEELDYKKRDNYYYLETKVKDEKIAIIKPTTYMNLSGEAIVKAKGWYKAQDEDIIAVYDDVDLKLGDFRYRESGSAGTHNGMRNVIDILKTENIKRMRIGIENRSNENIQLIDYVLGKFSEEEKQLLFDKVFSNVSDKLVDILKQSR